MTSKGPEARFKDAVKRSFESTYGKGEFFWKSIPGGILGGGWPDVYVAYRGSSLFIEFKVSPNKPTALQANVIKELNKHNARSACWLTKETDNLAFLYFDSETRIQIRRINRVWEVDCILSVACATGDKRNG